MPNTATHGTNTELDRCIDDCYSCANSCNTTVAYCLEKGGRHADAHIALMLDCAAICETAATSMSRNSTVHTLICRACAEICRKCEDSAAALARIRRCRSARTFAGNAPRVASEWLPDQRMLAHRLVHPRRQVGADNGCATDDWIFHHRVSPAACTVASTARYVLRWKRAPMLRMA